MINSLDVLRTARELGSEARLAQVEEAIATVDRAAIEQEELSRYRVEVWDRQSDINGVTARTVFESRNDIPPEGDIYLIYRDGALVIFQPNNPFLGGMSAIPAGMGISIGLRHVEQLIEPDVDARVVDKALRSLL